MSLAEIQEREEKKGRRGGCKKITFHFLLRGVVAFRLPH